MRDSDLISTSGALPMAAKMLPGGRRGAAALACVLATGMLTAAASFGFGGNTVDIDVLGHADDLCLVATNAIASSA